MSDQVLDFNRAAQAKQPLAYFRGLLQHLEAQTDMANFALQTSAQAGNLDGVYRSITRQDVLGQCIMALYPALPMGQELAPLSRTLVRQMGGDIRIDRMRAESSAYEFVNFIIDHYQSADRFWKYVVRQSTNHSAQQDAGDDPALTEGLAAHFPSIHDELRTIRETLLKLTPEYVAKHLAFTSADAPAPTL